MNPTPDPASEVRKLLAARRAVSVREEYVEGFLKDFHTRQRSEMLRTPAWRLAIERFGAALAEFQVPRAAYAGAFAVFVVSVSVTLVLPGRRAPGPEEHLAAATVSGPAMRLGADEVLVALPANFLPIHAGIGQHNPALPPRYVLDARPVSYEPPFTF